jgi:hypothetical protein
MNLGLSPQLKAAFTNINSFQERYGLAKIGNINIPNPN